MHAKVSRLDISTNMRMYLQSHVTWSGDGSGDGWRVARGHYSNVSDISWAHFVVVQPLLISHTTRGSRRDTSRAPALCLGLFLFLVISVVDESVYISVKDSICIYKSKYKSKLTHGPNIVSFGPSWGCVEGQATQKKTKNITIASASEWVVAVVGA